MTDFSDDELHTKRLTFMGFRYAQDLSSAKAAVPGVPFDPAPAGQVAVTLKSALKEH
jgi:hypothetical protein